MIATRFRSVVWVGCVAAAALSCYLVSQRVAAERATLTRVQDQIIGAEKDIRQLRTEIGTRGRMGQLERWNGDVLSLQAPAARQFIESEVRLASLNDPAPIPLDPAIVEAHGAVRLASAEVRKPAAPSAPAPDVAAEQPLLRQATYVKPKGEAMGVQPTRVSLLDADLLGDIGRKADTERSTGKSGAR